MHDHRALDISTRWARATRWSGVAHLDMRESDDGLVHLVEVNARYWTSIKGSLMADVNFPDRDAQAALGLPTQPSAYEETRNYEQPVALRRLLQSTAADPLPAQDLQRDG
ncbi:MAG: ATP-grasp domain-containing protein, partial [Gemmatimonadota bacterium]|nr:ATP-grasp domain-containing protein [Gemmatimonadota bacterium]